VISHVNMEKKSDTLETHTNAMITQEDCNAGTFRVLLNDDTTRCLCVEKSWLHSGIKVKW